MALNKIIEKILSDAEAEAKEIKARAEAQARELEEAAAKRAEERCREILAQAEKTAVRRRESVAALSRLQARDTELAGKRRLIDEVFEEAREGLRSDGAYPQFLKRLVVETAEGGETLIVDEEDAKRLGNGFLDEVNAELRKRGLEPLAGMETGAIGGGLLLRAGGVTQNCTLETIMEQLRAQLETDVARLLFGDGESFGGRKK